VLGWDFAFELNEVAKQQAAQAKVDLRFLRIPRDVMDKRAVEQGDVRFFELAALAVDVKAHQARLTGEHWQYIKVPQKEYEKLQVDEFADLLVFVSSPAV
jgi:adenine-specific DNA-methyltransferase